MQMLAILISFLKSCRNPAVVLSYPARELEKEIREHFAGEIKRIAPGSDIVMLTSANIATMNYRFEIESTWSRYSKEIVMVSMVYDQDLLSALDVPVQQEFLRMLKHYCRKFGEKLKIDTDIFKGFYIDKVEQYPDEELAQIQKKYALLKHWVKKLYVTVQNAMQADTPELLRLVAYHIESGISLFKYDWTAEGESDKDDLFSGMLSAINSFLEETVNRGNMEEIRMENGVLMAEKTEEYPVAFVLLTTKSNPVVRNALRKFVEKFHALFAQNYAERHQASIYEPATALVEECFGDF